MSFSIAKLALLGAVVSATVVWALLRSPDRPVPAAAPAPPAAAAAQEPPAPAPPPEVAHEVAREEAPAGAPPPPDVAAVPAPAPAPAPAPGPAAPPPSPPPPPDEITSGPDGAAMLLVPAGSVALGEPLKLVSTQAFYIDREPVSVSRFARFLAAANERDRAIARALATGEAMRWLDAARAARRNFMFAASGGDEVEVRSLLELAATIRRGPPAPAPGREEDPAAPAAGLGWFDAAA